MTIYEKEQFDDSYYENMCYLNTYYKNRWTIDFYVERRYDSLRRFDAFYKYLNVIESHESNYETFDSLNKTLHDALYNAFEKGNILKVVQIYKAVRKLYMID